MELAVLYEKVQNIKAIMDLPSAQPEREDFEWCTDCKEYDQTAHCCHRWTKVIRQTVEEIKAEQPERPRGEWLFEEYPDGYYHSECSVCKHWFVEDAFLKPYNFCPNCGARMVKDGDEE